MNSKIVTGLAVITDSIGKRLAYTYVEINDNGDIIKSNQKGSYVVTDSETLNLISELENKIKIKLN